MFDEIILKSQKKMRKLLYTCIKQSTHPLNNIKIFLHKNIHFRACFRRNTHVTSGEKALESPDGILSQEDYNFEREMKF